MKLILISLIAVYCFSSCSKTELRNDSYAGDPHECGRVIILYDWYTADTWNDFNAWRPTGETDTAYNIRTCDTEFLRRMDKYPHVQFVCLNDWRKIRVEVIYGPLYLQIGETTTPVNTDSLIKK